MMAANTAAPASRASRPSLGRWLLAAAAIAFGIATLVSGGRMLFGDPAARAEAGNIVQFVLVFNFAAGFAYVAAGLATLLRRRWAVPLARAIAALTLLVFAALGVYALSGGAHEPRTVIAMTVRSVFWVAQALLLARLPDRTLPA